MNAMTRATPGAAPVSRDLTDWHVVAVTRGTEIALARALGARGFRVMDLVRRVRVRRNRRARATVEAERAALPGYLVVEMGPGADWDGLFRFAQVVGVVSVAGAPMALSAAAVRRLEALRHSTALLGWRPSKGETVEVVGGWFDGARAGSADPTSPPEGGETRAHREAGQGSSSAGAAHCLNIIRTEPFSERTDGPSLRASASGGGAPLPARRSPAFGPGCGARAGRVLAGVVSDGALGADAGAELPRDGRGCGGAVGRAGALGPSSGASVSAAALAPFLISGSIPARAWGRREERIKERTEA